MTSKPRILLVEDNDDLRFWTHQGLEETYDVAEASTVKDAIDLVEKGGIDLVVTDLNLPGEKVEPLILAIRKLGTLIPVVSFSGHPDIQSISETLKVNAYVAKGKGLSELLDTIQGLLNKR